jgi:hypothetical protein
MLACVALVSSRAEQPVEALVRLASDFSPRYEMVRPDLVVVDIGGLGRLLGTPREIGETFCRVAGERAMIVSVGIAATRTTAMLLALYHASHEASHDASRRLTVVSPGREADAVASLPLTLLAAWPDEWLSNDEVAYLRRRHPPPAALDIRDTTGEETRGKTRGKRGRGSSRHYRLAPAPVSPNERVESLEVSASTADSAPRLDRDRAREAEALWRSADTPADTPEWQSPDSARASSRARERHERRAVILDVLRRWGVKTLGELARLPAAQIFERLAADGVALQQIARGQDARPLVPTTADEPFEATLALDWPIEELEPLSFVLTRLFEPLCARLERCDRGAAVLQVTLRLVTRACHTRRLELPAPMRDPKVLRTLVLLDLESHPPDAGIDRITITIDPTPGRIVQHSLLTRALPSPEQISTLTARLTALLGEGRVGAPALVDTHRPEAFAMHPFEAIQGATTGPPSTRPRARTKTTGTTIDVGRDDPHVRHEAARRGPAPIDTEKRADWHDAAAHVLRRFRRAIPARVRVEDDRPVHVTPDGLAGGAVIQAAGPWRTSGEWWFGVSKLCPLPGDEVPDDRTSSDAGPPDNRSSEHALSEHASSERASSHRPHPARAQDDSASTLSRSSPRRAKPPARWDEFWDRDEWDVELGDGRLYRIHHDRLQDAWFIDASLD